MFFADRWWCKNPFNLGAFPHLQLFFQVRHISTKQTLCLTKLCSSRCQSLWSCIRLLVWNFHYNTIKTSVTKLTDVQTFLYQTFFFLISTSLAAANFWSKIIQLLLTVQRFLLRLFNLSTDQRLFIAFELPPNATSVGATDNVVAIIMKLIGSTNPMSTFCSCLTRISFLKQMRLTN